MSKRAKRLRAAPPCEMSIESLSHQGKGIAKVDDKTTFVFNALEGEIVKAKYTMCRSKYDEAQAVEIIKASADRAEPICEYFGICGGCQLQHMQHQKQLDIKTQSLENLLTHVGEIKAQNWMAAIVGPTHGYRRKARLGVRQVDKKGDTLVGFRERAGRYLADMTSCQVLIPEIGQHLSAIRAMLSTLEARAQIAQIEVAQGENTALVFRNLVELCDDDINKLKHFGQNHKLKIYLQPKGPDSIYPIFPENADTLMHYELEGLQFAFSPTGFIQVNDSVNRQMIAKAMSLLDLQESDRVLDLFCGIGNFSLPIAKKVRYVAGIEASDEAVDLAKHNAQLNNINNGDFYSANLFENIDHLELSREQFDKLILDPPRSGAEHVIPYIKQWQPSHIAYISCNPATFARDAKAIAALGYKLTQVGIMDMFSHTEHTEVISLFTR